MSNPEIVARLLEGDRLECRIRSPRGLVLELAGNTSDVEPPHAVGSPLLLRNRALMHNAWAFAKFTHLKVNLPSAGEQDAAAKRAEGHRDVAEWIADLADEPLDEIERAWCSGCFVVAEHQKVKMPTGHLPAYLCGNCGSPTLPCAGPGCAHMAVRGRGAVRVPRFCAEHRHEIPGFSKADQKMASLGEYRQFLEFDQPNLSRITKLVGVGLAGVTLAAPAALLAAPAIGGAIGTMIGGYTGAAASSYGLALLGGGSLAAGGLGMAGGTMVVTAVGGTLGCALGASVTNAYVREDKSFHIEMLQGGTGVPVIVCNGFLSEGDRGWGEWKAIVTARYPDSSVYRVHWGAKELKDLGILAAGARLQVAGQAAIEKAALAATKSATKKLNPLASALLVSSLAKNPWHVAKNRADKTGAIVADLLARTEADSYVLIGHSLGARAMVVATQALGTKPGGPTVRAAHLLGAAIGADGDWRSLTERVDEAVYNYHSNDDEVLKYLYAVAQGGQKAAGYVGFRSAGPKVKNIDVTGTVHGHSDYHSRVQLS